MTNHTPEQWEAGRLRDRPLALTVGDPPEIIAEFSYQHGKTLQECEARARNAVACVSACAGINPEAVGDLMAFTQNILADATPGSHPRIYETPEEIRAAASDVLDKAKP